MKLAVVAFATAFTNMVLPVPVRDIESQPEDECSTGVSHLVGRIEEHLEGDQYRSCGTDRAVKGIFQPNLTVSLLLATYLCQRQLDCFSNLLLLRVQTTHILIPDIGLLIRAQHGDGRVRLGRQDVDEGIRVSVQGNRR